MKVLITGASSGIGKALAKHYAHHQHSVFACGRNKEKLAALALQHKPITSLVFDINQPAQINQACSVVDDLDLLILNAGNCEYIDNAKQFDGQLFARIVQTNLISVGYCLEALLPKLKTGGHLALMSSSATFVPLPRAEAYGASKAGVTYLAKTLAIDLAKLDISVSAIHPGFVDTPLTKRNNFAMPSIITPEQAARYIAKGIKQQKLDIHFPKHFTGLLKLFACLPTSWWHVLAKWKLS